MMTPPMTTALPPLASAVAPMPVAACAALSCSSIARGGASGVRTTGGGGGEWLNTATLCASGASHCDGRGVCLTSSACDLAANLLLDVASCPVDPDNSCRPRCAMTDANGALLGCHLVGGASFPEGATCETADGQRGACAVLDGGVGAAQRSRWKAATSQAQNSACGPPVHTIFCECRGRAPGAAVMALDAPLPHFRPAGTAAAMDAILATYYRGRDDAFWERPDSWATQ